MTPMWRLAFPHYRYASAFANAREAGDSDSDESPVLYDREFLRCGPRLRRDGLPAFRREHSRPER